MTSEADWISDDMVAHLLRRIDAHQITSVVTMLPMNNNTAVKTDTTVRWGILATARIASQVASAIAATPGAEVVAVASRSAERAAAWAEQHGVPRSHASYQALLEDDDVDVVYIPLPPSMHAEWTIRSAESGKHVLCEKALAMNAVEGAEMAAACHEHNVQLMDATMWVHHPRAVEMLRPIQNGEIGELRHVASAFSFMIDPYLQSKPSHMAGDPSSETLSLDRIVAHELRFQRSLGGGALFDLGWYNVRVALWAFGAMPARVFATARYQHDVDINLNAIMWYDDDRVATFDCGYDVTRRKWFEVAGTAGSVVCDDFLRPEKIDRPRFWLHDQDGNAAEHVSAPVQQEQCMIDRFCQIVRSGTLESQWPEISVANQRVCDAVAESARTGKVVEIR